MKKMFGLAAGLVLAAGAAGAQEQWDMPMAYSDSNYHSQNGMSHCRCSAPRQNRRRSTSPLAASTWA